MTDALDQIGPRLRDARRARGLTIDRLAALTHVSPSTLSRLESGKRGASLELLIPITRQLGIRVDDLLPDDDRDPRVRRASVRRDGMIIQPLSPEGAAVETFKITYLPRPDAPRPRVHDGYEWLYVVSGTVRLALGDRLLDLEAGDAAEFDTRTPHAFSAAGGEPAEVISIFNGHGARMHTRTGADEDEPIPDVAD